VGCPILTSTETKPSCTREIQVEVPAEVVARESESLALKYQKLARVPGFRRGKVPVTVIRQRYGTDLKADIIESLVPKYVQQEAGKQGLQPVSSPQITDLQLEDGEPLRFKATFEVLPEIEVSGYEGLGSECPEVAIAGEDVEKAIQNLREQQATYAAVEDRPLRDGDYAQISFRGTPGTGGSEGGGESRPVEVQEVMVEIGGADTVKEFTENLRGAQPGDERSFEVIYPPDYADRRLAGAAFRYTVWVRGVKHKQLPELNDEFARQVGEFETLDALKLGVRDGLKAERESAAEKAAKDKIAEQLLERYDFPVPEALIERQIDLRLERGLRALAAKGVHPQDLKKMDFTRLRAGQRESAAKEVKVSLILDRIAEREKIDASDAEVDREVELLARHSKQPVEEVRARLTREGALDRIRSRLRSEKTLDYLYRRTA